MDLSSEKSRAYDVRVEELTAWWKALGFLSINDTNASHTWGMYVDFSCATACTAFAGEVSSFVQSLDLVSPVGYVKNSVVDNDANRAKILQRISARYPQVTVRSTENMFVEGTPILRKLLVFIPAEETT